MQRRHAFMLIKFKNAIVGDGSAGNEIFNSLVTKKGLAPMINLVAVPCDYIFSLPLNRREHPPSLSYKTGLLTDSDRGIADNRVIGDMMMFVCGEVILAQCQEGVEIIILPSWREAAIRVACRFDKKIYV